MTLESTHPVVLFDLDNTIFDQNHSLRSAISAIQENYADLAGYGVEELIARYNAALQQAYDKYLYKEITYEEAEVMKVQLFFTGFDLPKPTPEEVTDFRATYKPAYRENRIATPGSIETLIRLREDGYRLAIVSNGQINDQTAKAEAIGIRHLVDRIVTSEEAGYCKPDHRIFEFSIEALGASTQTTYMAGDSVDTDINGALNAGLNAILYSPEAQTTQCLLFKKGVPIIRQMGQLLEHLSITKPGWVPYFDTSMGSLEH
ncbi:hypothetical protein DL771_003050 [Monosporascus sp. 5C6A]|nr:hypothetical protein DL771_003050 [Monosporascus sp. 5C6A]